MNENGNRYAIAALRERRAALDGEVKECDRKLRYLREAIGHIDATLSLFDPNGDPKEITAKRPYKRVKPDLNTDFPEPVDIAVILAKFEAAWRHAPKHSILAFCFGVFALKAIHFDGCLLLAGPHWFENDRPPREQRHRIRDFLRNQAEISSKRGTTI